MGLKSASGRNVCFVREKFPVGIEFFEEFSQEKNYYVEEIYS